MRRTRKRSVGSVKLKTQRENLREVLLCAARMDVWMTLGELSRKTRYPEASISAQLRHLRKAENGGFVVEKRRSALEETKRASTHELVWEYQMKYGAWKEEEKVDEPGSQAGTLVTGEMGTEASGGGNEREAGTGV